MANPEFPEIVVDVTRHGHSAMQELMELAALAHTNAVPFIGGRQNHFPLTGLGRNQAAGHGDHAVANGLIPEVAYSSPARRARETYELSATVAGIALDPVIDGRLQELDQGDWTGKPRSLYSEPEIQEEMWRKGSLFAPPGGESMNDVGLRGVDFFESVFSDIPRSPLTTPGAKPHYRAVFGHGVWTQCVVQQYNGLSHHEARRNIIHNVSRTRLVRQAGVWSVQFVGHPTVPIPTQAARIPVNR